MWFISQRSSRAEAQGPASGDGRWIAKILSEPVAGKLMSSTIAIVEAACGSFGRLVPLAQLRPDEVPGLGSASIARRQLIPRS
jgi:hypothetical protein